MSNPVGKPAQAPTSPIVQAVPDVVIASVPQQPQAVPPSSSGGSKLKIIIIAFIVIFILALIGGGTAYAIAYEKIEINNPEVEKKVTQFIQGLPFTPKTPKFLLNAAVLAHDKVTSFDFDVSIAAKSNSLTSVLGTDQGDFSIQGAIDYKDPAKINFSLKGLISKDFDVDLKKKDQFFYLKINKIPLTVLAFLGIKDQESIKPILENWVGIDTTPSSSDARKTLDSQTANNPTINENINDQLNKFTENKILNAITVSSEDLDNEKTFKLVFKPDNSVWDYIDQENYEEQKKKYPNYSAPTTKTSDTLEKFIATMWLSQKDYLVKKLEIVADVKSDTPSSFISPFSPSISFNYSMIPGEKEKTVTSVVGVVNLSAYNQAKNVEVPSKYMSPEEFYAVVMNAVSGKKVNANDTTRQADIEKIYQLLNTCYQASSPRVYPKTLDDLKSCNGVTSVPTDPASGQPYEYSTTNAARSKFTLRAKLDAGGYYEASEGGIIKNDSLGTTAAELTKRSRDAARLADLVNLQQAINVIRQEASSSSFICNGASGNCVGSSLTDTRAADGTGWVKVNLNQQKSVSAPTLPIDPTNDSTYKYLYCADGKDWEIITKLESSQYSSKMANDKGSDPTLYEIGSSLNLLNKIPGCTY